MPDSDVRAGDRARRVRRPVATGPRSDGASAALARWWSSDPANLFYLTGYDAWSFYTPQCLRRSGRRRAAPVRPGDGRGRARASPATCRAEQIHGYPEDLVHRPDVHPFDWIAARDRADCVPARRPTSASRATRTSSPRAATWPWHAGLPAQPARRLGRAGQLGPAGQVRRRARASCGSPARSPSRRCGSRCDGVRPGRRQCDVVAEILAAQAIGTPEHGGDYPAIVPMLPTGDAAGTPHLTWSERAVPVGRGDHDRAGRRLRPLPRAAGPHGDARRPAAAAHRHREGRRRGHGSRRWTAIRPGRDRQRGASRRSTP